MPRRQRRGERIDAPLAFSKESRKQAGKERGSGRGDWIRTSDPTVPNRVLYQAEPHPDTANNATCCSRLPVLIAPGGRRGQAPSYFDKPVLSVVEAGSARTDTAPVTLKLPRGFFSTRL